MIDVSVGTISARGQVALPAGMREKMRLEEGEKVIFLFEDDSIVIKRASSLPWGELTRPLRRAKKNVREAQVNQLVHVLRKR